MHRKRISTRILYVVFIAWRPVVCNQESKNTRRGTVFSTKFEKKRLIYNLLLVFLALALVQGQSRVIQRDLTATNFAKTIKGKKLSGNVIKEIGVTSLLNCQIECVKETRCLSYNFKAMTDKAPSSCYLSDSDRFRSFVNFTKDDEALYGGIQVLLFKHYSHYR